MDTVEVKAQMVVRELDDGVELVRARRSRSVVAVELGGIGRERTCKGCLSLAANGISRSCIKNSSASCCNVGCSFNSLSSLNVHC